MLKDKLRELCHEGYQGMVQIVYNSTAHGTPLKTEWFNLWNAPLIYFVDHLDSEIVSVDLFDQCIDPEDQECQITVAYS